MNLKWNLLAGVRNAEGVDGGGSGSDGGAPAGGAAGADSGAPSDGGAPAAGGAAGSAADSKPDAAPRVAVDGTVPDPKAPEGDEGKPKENEEGKNEDVKDGEDDKPAELKAEDYKFVLPDGAEPDPAQAEAFTAFAIEHKVPPELAQKLVDYHAAQMSAQVKAWTDQVNAWGEATRNDPEYGGAEYEQNMGVANRALAEFGGPKLGEAARLYGWGNHPEFVRMMVNVGKALGAPSTEKGGGQGNMGTSIPLAQALYPDMK